MTKINKSKIYDLEERTFNFAKKVCLYCRKLPKYIANIEYIKQVIRSSGSIGANYIEANEALSKKDFIMRIRISRKEAKETGYWLRLLISTNPDDLRKEGMPLVRESVELKKILSAILEKV
jgi:four helix bundle protein